MAFKNSTELYSALPERLKRSLDAISARLHERGLPLRPGAFTPQSLRSLFPSSFRPTELTTALFPHTARQSHLLFTSPLELARQDCKLRQEQLAKLRDERARELGELLLMRTELETSIKGRVPLATNVLNIRKVLVACDVQLSTASISGLQDLA